MGLHIIILAAGKGTRMHSDLPKVLHKVAGLPMLAQVIKCAQKISPQAIHVVVGHGSEQVKEAINDDTINWCLQKEQFGTGHAVQQTFANLKDEQNVLVLYGDVPLLTHETLQQLTNELSQHDLVILSAKLDDPTGYGRIVRDKKNKVQQIVEQKDADDNTLSIKEVNSGILATRTNLLKQWISKIDNENAQQEFYLTDCIELAVKGKHNVEALVCNNADEILGINSKSQLAEVERIYQRRIAENLMAEGATLMDPSRIDVRGELHLGKNVEIDVNSVFEGSNTLGDGVVVGVNAVIINSTIEAGTHIHANCHIENATIGRNCELGPFARLRPETKLDNNVKVGNFVEIKKSKVKAGSKISHLSYIGDCELGKDVNIGAGTITCNYDGANKHRTIIGDNVFVGSDTQFIAPVKVGDGATIGAGSTITKDTPKNKLTLARNKQVTIDNWQRPKKNK
jgi:bifunctional UDP-N-acetylglucosamine pyrophosphorylase/glucosamine-1-phosphate N-acetyltransferase